MADKRITELNLTTDPQASDLFALVNSGETKRVPYGTVRDKIHESYDTGSLMVTGSISGTTLTFKKGDTTTFDIDISEATPGVGGSGLGWARYDDSQYTTSSAFTILSGQTEVLPNNSSFKEETYMNSAKSFYDSVSQKFQAENVGDVYSVVITFKAKAPNANQTHMDLSLSSTGATPYDRVSKSIIFAKGNDVWENIYESFHYYSDADFVTNGNQWVLEADGGSVQVADVIYFIQRTFNAG